jgi:signal transduction histidine kinase
LDRGQPFEVEYRLRRHDGVYRWHLTRALPVRDKSGRIEQWVATSTDITEQKQAAEEVIRARDALANVNADLEQRIVERTARLRETVAELEHFSYTLTHDLRAPLRAMHGFGELLSRHYADRLDAPGRDYLRRIVQAAERMDLLITDALNYSRVLQAEFPLQPVDPAALLRGMIESYPEFQLPHAEIRVDGMLPLVEANRAGLTQCFSNLLSNAVKFVTPGTLPRIRVSAEDRGNRVRLWFEDNGVGIPSDQQQRIFGMFQRMSAAYPGTGVGLALVLKVVERMRGEVGVESAEGTGSRFWVEFAKASEPH